VTVLFREWLLKRAKFNGALTEKRDSVHAKHKLREYLSAQDLDFKNERELFDYLEKDYSSMVSKTLWGDYKAHLRRLRLGKRPSMLAGK
jgi:hypothetical protein